MISLANLLTEQYGKSDRLLILATTLVLEAGGEGQTGMLAVAHVIANRAKENHNGWGSRAVQQVLRPYQFSMWNGFNAGNERLIDVINKARARKDQWAYAEKLAKLLDANSLSATSDPTKGSVYYYNPKTADPDSVKQFAGHPNYKQMATIGKHNFGKIVKATEKTAVKNDVRGGKTYIIKPGEVLGGIADRNNTTVDAILKLNPGLKADQIKAGQKIRL